MFNKLETVTVESFLFILFPKIINNLKNKFKNKSII